MDVEPFLQILGYLGTLGIGALVGVLVKAYLDRREESRQYFRELVLNPHFLRFVGAMESLADNLGKITDEMTPKDARLILEDSSKAYRDYYRELVNAGGSFFLPSEVRKGLDEIGKTLSQLPQIPGVHQESLGDATLWGIAGTTTIRVQLQEARSLIKKYLGIPE